MTSADLGAKGFCKEGFSGGTWMMRYKTPHPWADDLGCAGSILASLKSVGAVQFSKKCWFYHRT